MTSEGDRKSIRDFKRALIPPETVVHSKPAGIIELLGGVDGETPLFAGVFPVQELPIPTDRYAFGGTHLGIKTTDVYHGLLDISDQEGFTEAKEQILTYIKVREIMEGYIFRERYSFTLVGGSEVPVMSPYDVRNTAAKTFDRIDQDYQYDDPDKKDRMIIGFQTTSYRDRLDAEISLLKLIHAFLPKT